MSNFVFVLDTNHKPLNPCKPGVARSLLKAGKAAVFRRFPFTIILKKEVKDNAQPMQLKIDPGSKTTGIVLLQADRVVWAAELQHRGQQVKDSLESRRSLRRGRRARKTRYRRPPKHEWSRKSKKFKSRHGREARKPVPSHRRQGWLPPSLQHRVLTTMTWVNRLRKFTQITSISMELVRFDTQLMQNAEISGVEYQQGELAGYELREYLLEKWGRQCVYCDKKDTPLEIEHIHTKSKGGSNRVSNLTLACNACNLAKGNQDIKDFLVQKPDILKRILSRAKQPLKDAAAVNSTRWALFHQLKLTRLPLEVGTGGRTKYNRLRLNLTKTHWLDAACVGAIDTLDVATRQPLIIKATGHGTRQMCGTNKHGFPIRHRSKTQIHKGFQTGDMVKAVVTLGKKVGTYVGRVMCRASGSFDISTQEGRVSGISHKYCEPIHKKDGYNYAFSSGTPHVPD